MRHQQGAFFSHYPVPWKPGKWCPISRQTAPLFKHLPDTRQCNQKCEASTAPALAWERSVRPRIARSLAALRAKRDLFELIASWRIPGGGGERLTETHGGGNQGVTRRCKGWALSKPHGLQTKRTCTMAIARPQEQWDKNNTPSLRSEAPPRQRPKGSRQPSRHVPDASVLFGNQCRSSPQGAPKQTKNRNSQEQKAPLLGPLLLLLNDWTALVMSEMSH